MAETRKRDLYDRLIIILLGGMLTVGISQIIITTTNTQRLSQAENDISRINRDYTPFFIVDAIIESNHYRADEIIATINKDPEAVKEIQKKYDEMQNRLMKQLSDISRTRGTSTGNKMEK